MTSPPDTSLGTTAPVPQGLRIASILSWLLGIVALGMGFAIGFAGQAMLLGIGMGASGLALFAAGFGLRKSGRSAGWTAIAAAGSFMILQLIATGGRMAVSTYLYLAIIGLVATNVKHLRSTDPTAGS